MHARAVDTRLEKGLDYIGEQLKLVEDKKRDSLTKQFYRFVRCKTVMEGLVGGGVGNMITEMSAPLDQLKSNFAEACELNASAFKDILAKQSEIEKDPRFSLYEFHKVVTLTLM